jgi:cytoskeletal protein RodZ
MIMDSIGQYIKSIREEQSLSLDDLARLTLIKKSFLELLEEDNIEELGGFGVVKSYAFTIVRKLNINQTKVMSIIDNKYPQYKVNNFKSLAYKEQKKFLISANVIYAIILITITIFLVIYVVDMFKSSDFSIFKAHSELKESKAEEVESNKIIIELPPPAEREN